MSTNSVLHISELNHTFLFTYSKGRERELMRIVGNIAGKHPDMMTWKGAAAINAAIRQEALKDIDITNKKRK